MKGRCPHEEQKFNRITITETVRALSLALDRESARREVGQAERAASRSGSSDNVPLGNAENVSRRRALYWAHTRVMPPCDREAAFLGYLLLLFGTQVDQANSLEGTMIWDRVQKTAQRVKTNDSLRVEREKTDQAVASGQKQVAQHADAVVELARDNADAVLNVARENADAVLDAARDKADELLQSGEGERHADPAATILVAERERADGALRDERDNADETLRQERADYARSLRTFLPLERESTDRFLRSERMHSDDALVNRDDFLAIVTHDLRDLLGGIVMSATVISKRAPQDEEGQRTLAQTGRIQRYAARMNRLIGDLTDVASIDAGKLAVSPSLGDLAGLISEAEDSFRATASAKGISVMTRIAAGPLMAAFDHDRILQVLANLISNSLRFTPEGGKITIYGEPEGASVRLSIVDTGTGIPEGALDSVFERFSQADRKNRRGGLGLGLYISRCIVEAHGGRIWAQSQPGAGTSVSLTLPAHAPAAATVASRPE